MKRDDLAGLVHAAEFEDSYDSAETALRFWWQIVADAKRGHDGDCTNQPQRCSLCTVEKFRAVAKLIEPEGLLALLGDGGAAAHG